MGQLAVGGKAADCQPVWVTMWVRQLTHILTHTVSVEKVRKIPEIA